MPKDVKMLPKKQCLKIEEWCRQVPLQSEPDQKTLCRAACWHLTQSECAKSIKKIIFLLTQGFHFLDIINWTSYEKWMKAYECTAEKLWFPYAWLDTLEKLDYPRLPVYPVWC